jgi:tetratricopeptide (TPR) repeat protein
VFGRAYLIMSLAEMGRFREAVRYEAEAVELAEPTQHAHTISWAYLPGSVLHLLRGDWPKALSRVERWIAILQSGHVAIQLPWAIASSAWALAEVGDRGEALTRVKEGEQLLEGQTRGGIIAHRGFAYHALGRACLELGLLDDAHRFGQCALEASLRQPGFAAHALRLAGDIARHPERFDAQASLTHYLEALKLAQQRDMRSLAAHCQFGLGQLYRRLGPPQQAYDAIKQAMAMYHEMDMTLSVKQAEADLSSDARPRARAATSIIAGAP